MKNIKLQTYITEDMEKIILNNASQLGISKNDYIRTALIAYNNSMVQTQNALNLVAEKILKEAQNGTN